MSEGLGPRSLANRFVGPGFTMDKDGSARFDIGHFVERLLLFDGYVMESARLTEIPEIVAAFGYQGASQMIESGAVEIYCDAFSIGEGGPGRRHLPLGSYRFTTVRDADPKSTTSRWLQPIMSIPGLTHQEARRLKSLVGTHVKHSPPKAGLATLDGTRADLVGKPEIARQALGLELSRGNYPAVEQTELELSLTHADGVYTAESNVAELTGADARAAHLAIQRALLAVVRLNFTVEWMETFSAVSAFQFGDLPLYRSKLALVAQTLQGGQREVQLGRVADLAGLPDLAAAAKAGRVDYQRLLEVRSSDEARDFRKWLAGTDELQDEEVRKLVGGLGQKVRRVVQSPAGRVLRVLVPTAIDTAWGTGGVAGLGCGLLDQFIWDRVLPNRGPWSFVDDEFPSLFLD